MCLQIRLQLPPLHIPFSGYKVYIVLLIIIHNLPAIEKKDKYLIHEINDVDIMECNNIYLKEKGK